MKNPFELRYDLLALTQEHLETQYHANVKLAQALIEAAIAAGTDSAEAITKFMPKFPTIEDILKEAKKFYTFVDLSK